MKCCMRGLHQETHHDKAGAGSSLHMRRFSEEDIVVGDVEIVLGILYNCSGISSSMDNMLEQLHNCQEEWKEHLLTISQGIWIRYFLQCLNASESSSKGKILDKTRFYDLWKVGGEYKFCSFCFWFETLRVEFRDLSR